MTTVSVAVMHHPARAHMLPDLLDRLDVNATIVTDRWNSRWDTGRRALLAYHPEAELHVVVQDDAVVCQDFAAGVARIAEHVPDGHPIGLYLGRGMPRSTHVTRLYERAKARGYRWVVMRRSPMWGVALVIPTSHIRDLVARADLSRTPVYDGRIAGFYRRRGIACWYPVPSLVDHRDKAENPSLVNPKVRAGRVAHEFIGVDASPLDIDWATGHVRGG